MQQELAQRWLWRANSRWVNVLRAGVPALAPFLSAWFLLTSVSLSVCNFLSCFPLRCG